tara:strand:- start:1718 stop:1882 length:165 start_codon:yes stop_codon:yes gene_type:complete
MEKISKHTTTNDRLELVTSAIKNKIKKGEWFFLDKKLSEEIFFDDLLNFIKEYK